MKVCEKCGEEIATPDGDNLCPTCDADDADRLSKANRAERNRIRRERDQAYRDCGMVKVRGALGGTYYE